MQRGPDWLTEPAYNLLALLDCIDGGRGSLCIDCIAAMRPYDRAEVEATAALLSKHDAVEWADGRLSLSPKGERILRPNARATV